MIVGKTTRHTGNGSQIILETHRQEKDIHQLEPGTVRCAAQFFAPVSTTFAVRIAGTSQLNEISERNQREGEIKHVPLHDLRA